MTEIVPRMRILSAKRGSPLEPDRRDKLIQEFCEEVETVVCLEVLGQADDSALQLLYSDWIHWKYANHTVEDRRNLLVKSISITPRMLRSVPKEPSLNVVKLK